MGLPETGGNMPGSAGVTKKLDSLDSSQRQAYANSLVRGVAQCDANALPHQ